MAAEFEKTLKTLELETEHVTCKFLGFEQEKDVSKAKMLLSMKNGKASNLVLIRIPQQDGDIFVVQSTETAFDSEVNGFAVGGPSISQYIRFLMKCYYQKIGGGDELMDASDGEEEDWDDGNDEDWDAEDDPSIVPDPVVASFDERKEKERYSKMKLDLLDKDKELRANHQAHLHEENLKANQIFKPESVAMMLVNSILRYTKAYDSGDKSIEVEPIDMNIYEWRVKFSNFPPESGLYLDLMKLGDLYGDEWNCVELRVSFLMELFPIYPPKVRLVRPRLENFMFGRIVCMDELQVAKWNPVRTLEEIFGAIRILLEKFGHVDIDNPVNNPRNERPPFTELEYQLLRLSMLTEVPFRANTLMNAEDYKMAALPEIGSKFFDKKKEDASPPKKKQKTSHNPYNYGGNTNYKAWASGTGYGHAGDQKDWDMAAWKLAQQKKDSEILSILDLIVHELQRPSDKKLISGSNLKTIFEESCIIPFLKEYLRNDSLLDIEQHHAKLYGTVYAITKQMAAHKELLELFHDRCKSPSTNNTSLWEILDTLNQKASIANALSSGTGGSSSSGSNSGWFGNLTGGSKSVETTSVVGKIVDMYNAVDKALRKHKIREKDVDGDTKMDDKEAETGKESKEKADKKYMKMMGKLRFAMVDDNNFLRTHHYASKPSETNKQFLRRLSYEYSDMSKSLPINPDSSVFLRVHEQKMHFAKMLIIPCDGTPYGGGAFVFDAYFPPQYPNTAPKVNLMTTGKGSVRFNPNLYNCGKVCLSLLGTWHGGAQGENWNPGVSTFLQVCVSIQSLIFVPEPYFNEPGYERSMGTPQGKKESKRYNDNIQLQCVRWAMVDILKNPPACFETVIKTHFRLHKERVLKNAKEWLGDKHKLVGELSKLLKDL